MAKRSLRDQILRAGLPVMFRCGYHAASVRDICAAAGAPQGSFTNHFRSKEAFAVEVLDQYFDYLKGLVSEALNDETLTLRQRLKRYLDVITDKLEHDRWMLGCLIGDFSLQVSSHSRLLRKRLDSIFREWRTLFASCIAAARRAALERFKTIVFETVFQQPRASAAAERQRRIHKGSTAKSKQEQR